MSDMLDAPANINGSAIESLSPQRLMAVLGQG